MATRHRKHGYDKAMGARPMARIVQSTLKAPLANEIRFGKLGADASN